MGSLSSQVELESLRKPPKEWILQYANEIFIKDFSLGSSPDRGRSPVEWRDQTSVHTYFPPLGHPARPDAQPVSPEA